MTYAQTTVGFPPQQRVRKDHKDKIVFPLNGKAPPGLWNHKLEFGAEVIREHPAQAGTVADAQLSFGHVSHAQFEEALEQRRVVRRAFDLGALPEDDFPHPVFCGETMAVSVFTASSEFASFRFRHADAHTLCFVHQGQGWVATDFGLLRYKKGDFLYLPRGTTYRFSPSRAQCVVMYEFLEPLMRPNHFWIDGYPFAQSALVPASPERIEGGAAPRPDGKYPVFVKRHMGKWTIVEYPFSPFDAVAWEGETYPFVLHLQDIRALSSTDFHIDPKALTVFATESLSVSVQVFLPRFVHSLPYPHQNYCDELLLNHSGYSARPEIKDAFMTLHPAGTFHGPDVRAQYAQNNEAPKAKRDTPWREEVAVLVEANSPLAVLAAAECLEARGYDSSWHEQYAELMQRLRDQSS